MKAQIICSSIYPLTKFGTIGKVHSTFEHSLNISINSQLINISSFDDYLPCFGIHVTRDVLKLILSKIKTEDLVKIKNQMIKFYSGEGILTLDLSDFTIVSMKVCPLKNIPLEKLQSLKSSLENKKLIDQIGLDNNSELMEIVDKLLEIDKSSFKDVSKWLVGRGKGLTPSGDDLLCGYSFILWLCNVEAYSDLVSSINDRLDYTTDVSKSYLANSVAGVANSKLYNLYLALKSENDADWNALIDDILRIGHSSGKDMSYGIQLGISAVLRKWENEK